MKSLVGVIMGSTSDWETMKYACDILDELNIPYEKKVVSAHRTPDYMFEYAETARERGLKVIIAGAGGAAHLPGMVAAKTNLPVIGVQFNQSIKRLRFIIHRPNARRCSSCNFAIGKASSTNAGLIKSPVTPLYENEWFRYSK
ncbi:5-(carboxyamino)imidazole ribonucleotide mutase [Bacillus cereus]|uniref:5-(carboxyamino)imidazole ribonucleotide mutase n=1 Tax=Bacillus cereus TaxID=1396 RepID=UPI000B7CF566